MHETGHPKPAHWDAPEGWSGEGFKMGDTRTPVPDSCQCMAEITAILKSS